MPGMLSSVRETFGRTRGCHTLESALLSYRRLPSTVSMLLMGNLMPTHALRSSTKLFVVVTLSLVLASCDTSTPPIVCDGPSSSNGTCTCGQGTSACPVSPGPEFLYTAGSGQIQAFSIDRNNGALTTVGSMPGPATTFGLTAVSNQFLYVSDPADEQLDSFLINQTTGALTARSWALRSPPEPSACLQAWPHRRVATFCTLPTSQASTDSPQTPPERPRRSRDLRSPQEPIFFSQ